MQRVKGLRKKYSYSEVDSELGHKTWGALVDRQKKLIWSSACKEFKKGFKKLALDPHHLPVMREVSKRLSKMSGWTLTSAYNRNLSMADWFPHIRRRVFPVTDYIRSPENINYAPQPDLFHEYFGHLALYTDRKLGDIAHLFGAIARRANRRQLSEISRLWWYSMEAGIVKENGKLKILGAGLLSSIGESTHARKMIRTKKVVPYTIDEVIKTKGSTHAYHQKYFYIESTSELRNILLQYAKRESLPVR